MASDTIIKQPDGKVVECKYTEHTHYVRIPYDRFWVWKGTDFWHQDLCVQVRLEPDGSVCLCTTDRHINSIQSTTVSVEQFHELVREFISKAREVKKCENANANEQKPDA